MFCVCSKIRSSIKLLFLLAMLKNNVNEKVKLGSELSDELVLNTVATEAKKRKEALKIYQDSNETERAEQESAELEILNEYLPAQLSEDEIRKVVQAKVATLDSKDISQLGQIMGQVKSELQNSADMSLVAQIVKEELSS